MNAKKLLALILALLLVFSCGALADTIEEKQQVYTDSTVYTLPDGEQFLVPVQYTVIVKGDGSGNDDLLDQLISVAYGVIDGDANYFTFGRSDLGMPELNLADMTEKEMDEFAASMAEQFAASLSTEEIPHYEIMPGVYQPYIHFSAIDMSAAAGVPVYWTVNVTIINGIMYQANYYTQESFCSFDEQWALSMMIDTLTLGAD